MAASDELGAGPGPAWRGADGRDDDGVVVV